MSDKLTGWMVDELDSERSPQKVSSGFAFSSLDLVKSFYEWQFRAGTFDFALIARRGGGTLFGFHKTQEANLCQVILGIDQAKDALETLQVSANRGFELVVASNSSLDEIEEFWKQMGYRLSGRSQLGSRGEHDLLPAAWNPDVLEHTLSVASRMGGKTLCVFAHDADPIYLLTKITNQR